MPHGRGDGLMGNTPIPGESGLGSSPGWGHCIAFLGKTLNCHSVSLHQGVQMGTGEFLENLTNYREVTRDGLACHLGGEEIL